MSSLAFALQPLSSPKRIKVMDIGEDGHDFELFKTFPFFIDVLEWLDGGRPFQNIRHTFAESDFKARILPNLLKKLRRAKLVRDEQGQVVPTHEAVLLRNMPRDPWIHCEIASSQIDETLKRCLEESQAPVFESVRTKAKLEMITDWKRRLSNLLAEIDMHDDPDGIPFSLNILKIIEG